MITFKDSSPVYLNRVIAKQISRNRNEKACLAKELSVCLGSFPVAALIQF